MALVGYPDLYFCLDGSLRALENVLFTAHRIYPRGETGQPRTLCALLSIVTI